MIYIFFIFFWPFINYLGSNISKITFDYSLAVIAFVLLGLSISTFIIIKIFKKPTDRFLFTVFMSILLFFGYGYIYDHTAAIISNLYIIIPAIKTSYFYALIFTVVIYFSWMVSAKKTFQTVS
ncbi:MAG: hypothetical protein KKE11_02015, partial [Gammaproteobacteria bacterium]|nr:hypothetical protein [Gammaproteobacteria bacterium]